MPIENYHVAKEAGIKIMILILKKHGISMRVDGCGCCDSPGVTFVYNGEAILDAGCCNFDTEAKEPDHAV